MLNKPIIHVETLIIGTGFSGIGLAIRLQQEHHKDFIILEKAASVGGCWRDNTYPGAACDVPSHLYSFSFETNPNWGRRFSGQTEILAYMQGCISKHQLQNKIRFQQEVAEAKFDATSGLWQISTVQGQHYQARFLISACGQLSRPAYPNLKGIDNFKGAKFHSATWDHSFDLKNKKVAVIGTGASAIQFIPAIVDQVAELNLFQRSPPHVLPKPDRAYRAWEKTMFRRLPFTQSLSRLAIYSQYESRAIALGPLKFLLKGLEWSWKNNMHRHVKEPELRAKLSPDYTIGCKRILLANDYYPSLAKDNVAVDVSGVEEVKAHSIVSKEGAEYPVDAIIFGTGFKATEFLAPMKITGLGNVDLNSTWLHGAEAYKGITITGFPNLMMLYGPNTNVGHNSIVYLIESQIKYILDYIKQANTKQLRYMDVKTERQQQFNQKLHHDLQNSVWNTGGCTNWYLTDEGKNTNNWSGLTLSYRKTTQKINLHDYHQVGS